MKDFTKGLRRQEIEILYQNDDLAVLSKPAGIVVNRTDTVTDPTVQDWWMEQLAGHTMVEKEIWQTQVPADFASEYGTPEEIFAQRGGIAHRLDKETSGALLVAKHPGALVNLLAQFRERKVNKEYVCLVHGRFQILSDVVSLPLGRASWNRTKFAVVSDGRVAETKYEVQEFFPELDFDKVMAQMTKEDLPKQLRKSFQKGYQGFSLVKCWPKTGRTHQIRVHMDALRHPIVADSTYLGKKRALFDSLWCPRLFLHAAEIAFIQPRTGEVRKVQAPLPQELSTVLDLLQKEG